MTKDYMYYFHQRCYCSFITYDDDALKLFINDEIALNIRSLKLVKVHAKIAILMLL